MPILINPVPGSTKEKNSRPYATDSGVDIHVPVGTKVVAAADGYILYSEYGHTRWTTPPDTPYSILILLKKPITIKGKTYKYLWYTHMKTLTINKEDDGSRGREVKAGEILGTSGCGNKVPHLHFGLLINRAQNDGDFMPPFELEKLIYDQPSTNQNQGQDQNQNQPEKDNKSTLKVFIHDGKASVIFNGKPKKDLSAEIVIKFED